jgi:squalene-hopene/tetraprenyl-beta-curcumene cyclase
MALKALGYSNEHPVIRNALRACRELIWPMTDKALCMPCVSPNWDTALAVRALKDAGLQEEHPALAKAASWFIDQQVFKRGDWAVKRPDLEPGGWPFEFFNDAYPDVDDSAIIVSNLAEMSFDDRAARDRAIKAGANWVIGMQSSDGGFAAFDVDSKSGWLNQLPLADVEAVTDPTCPDLTGRALEMMGAVGYDRDYPAAQRAIEWLKREQEREGSWWGRWGVNHIYGTFSALCGLRAVGVDMEEEWIGRAVKWLKSKQNADGGWGEACLSDRDASWRGCGRSTPSQTSWALMGLLAGEKGIDESATRAVKWLLENQNSAGVWEESESTGNGFPNHFYLRYYLYPHYFPLMALGRFRRRLLERPE